GNTDQYQAVGNVAASNTPTVIEITSASITLTYLGNSFGTGSSGDRLTIDFTQYFSTPSFGTNNSGFEFVTGDFSGNISGVSSVQAQLFSTNGTAMALMGPFFPPAPFTDSRSNQPFSVSLTAFLDFRDSVIFGLDSGVGATINLSDVPTAVPEPATWLYLA